MAEPSFDLIVVGGGPGGYVAAIRAAQLGMKTAVVEREHLGGICLNWGCIPTKALLRTADAYHLIGEAEEFGLKVKGVEIDFKKVIERSRKVAARLSAGVAHLLKKNKVTVVDGHGRLAGAGKIRVEKNGKAVADLTAKHIILATGARARTLADLEPDGELIWTYKEAMTPKAMPKSVLVIGSGAIGIEFASFYRTLGANVTVVEVLPKILPVEDDEICALAHKAFVDQGITIHTSAKVSALKKEKNSVSATVAMDSKRFQIEAERVILAVGIVGNVEELGIEKTAVKVKNTHVITDQWSATGEPGVYAIGDLCGPPWLAHKAMHEGIVCVEKIAGQAGVHPLDVSRVPGCTYCRPQVASIGLTEQAAADKGLKVRIGRFPFLGNGKALAMGEPEGLIKTVFDDATGELVGAHMIGAEVTELIQGYAIAQTLESTESELMQTVFPHPTLSEMMQESVLDAYGRTIHF
jgi:dihydrolipoamide dehydrogenase